MDRHSGVGGLGVCVVCDWWWRRWWWGSIAGHNDCRRWRRWWRWSITGYNYSRWWWWWRGCCIVNNGLWCLGHVQNRLLRRCCKSWVGGGCSGYRWAQRILDNWSWRRVGANVLRSVFEVWWWWGRVCNVLRWCSSISECRWSAIDGIHGDRRRWAMEEAGLGVWWETDEEERTELKEKGRVRVRWKWNGKDEDRRGIINCSETVEDRQWNRGIEYWNGMVEWNSVM